jgi:hypothetical protein
MRHACLWAIPAGDTKKKTAWCWIVTASALENSCALGSEGNEIKNRAS